MMVSSSLLLTEACRFKLEPYIFRLSVFKQLFQTYSEIFKACLDKAVNLIITSRRRLHETIYRELRAKYSAHPSHYIYTTITQALAIYKSHRRLSRRRKDVNLPNVENLNAILLDDTHLFWFSWGSLKLATHRGHIILPFKVHEHSEKFVDWRVRGSRLVRRGGGFFLHVTFRKVVEEKEPEGVLGIDVNEKSVDLAIVKPENVRFIKIDISEAKYIRDRYFRKRRRIQGKASEKAKAKLLAKYSGREKRRVNNILHKASKLIARIIAEDNVKPVMEKLTNIRERIWYGRKMDRGLQCMPFRKVQSCNAYKSMEQGFKREHAKAKNTSRTCPTCSELNKPNWHVYKCKACGFQEDRQLVAAWNIAAKPSMRRPLPLAAEAFNEPLIIVVRGRG